MKTIVCTGDSHTWGQGPHGVEAYFNDPPVCGGDLRPVPFTFPCYVNLLRDEINSRTGSFAIEKEPKTEIGELVISERIGLARFFYRFGGHNHIIAESVFANTITETENAIYIFNETLTVKPKHSLYLYRYELYGGSCAVINAGVGSCTTTRYLSQFYENYVRTINPSVIVAEAHTINDWLNRISLSDVNGNLKNILTGCSGARAILVTVSPIGGETALPFNELEYDLYIKESRRAAEEADAKTADANKIMGTDKFTDNWHVNEAGHRVYFKTILDALDKFSF